MCLSNVNTTQVIPDDMTVYKVVINKTKQCSHYKSLFNHNNKKLVRVPYYFKDSPLMNVSRPAQKQLKSENYQNYANGFHFFLTIEDAKSYMGIGRVVLSCTIPKGTLCTFGTQMILERLNVVIASRFIINKVEP